MISQEHLEKPYSNVILTDVVAPVDELLRRGSMTLVNSVLLGGREGVSVSLTDLKGLGKEIWSREEAQRYVDRLRKEWGR